MSAYWDDRFCHEGRIWGMTPSRTAEYACGLFKKREVTSVLVPGAGYGRNALLFARAGFAVTGVEVSAEAIRLADRNNIAYIHGSFLNVPLAPGSFGAIYCYNVLHLFRKGERALFMARSVDALRPGGFAFFAVFSDAEPSFGKGREIEEHTFESKPGRPVHYFSEEDLIGHFAAGFDVLETGTAEDEEEHGEEGKHVHRLRYVFAKRKG